MKPTIRPIPTWWRGNHFRSRLEVKWAIYLTELGIDFQYEPQGYVLPGGICYLPDFYFPELQSWAEVKPNTPSLEEIEKAIHLVHGSTKPLIFLIGEPTGKDCPMFVLDGGNIRELKFHFGGRDALV